ncbi:MAG: pyridoxal phosphate-dependent aminotransferase [Lachnospiraceae bacterium]|nr:pyridoxal phosphate-dependent aminotransferase [Lachnospiraceae bacterium]
MAEKNLDFDTVIDRRDTNSLKYDFAKRRGMPDNLLPLWVADMDFKTSSYVLEALLRQTEHGIFGYSEVQEEYFEALRAWMERHYNWSVEQRWLVKTPGIVYALAMAVRAFTKVGDGVLIQFPVYYPFREIIEVNDRRVISNTLVQDEKGRYHMDIADFENKIIKENIKLFFLCNPHNPVGRVWTEKELTQIGDICLKHHVIVVSDEIHADFVFKGRHHVFSNIKEEYKDFTITCTSPSKTFNLAGLQISNIFIPNRELRKRFRTEIDASGYSQLNIMGLVACEAAYRDGDEWYYAMLDYIRGNIEFTKEFIGQRIPQIKMTEPEGTYLVWLDFRGLKLKEQELENLIIKKAGLWLDSGAIFGESGTGFQRINVACPRVILTEALKKLEQAVNSLIVP